MNTHSLKNLYIEYTKKHPETEYDLFKNIDFVPYVQYVPTPTKEQVEREYEIMKDYYDFIENLEV